MGMKKNIATKSIAIALVGVSMITPILSTTYAMENAKAKTIEENITYDETTIINQGYESTIKTVVNSDNTRSYLINENGVEYKISYDFVNESVTINETQTYKLDDFFQAIDNQVKSMNARKQSNLLDEINSFETIEKSTSKEKSDNNIVDIDVRSSFPTSGYGKEYSAGTYKKLSMKYALTGAAIGAIAEFVFTGNVTVSKAYVKKVLTAAAKGGLIGTINDTINGDQYYNKYQRQHSTTSAVRERRQPYSQIQKLKVYGDSFTWHFWSQRP